MIIVKTQNELNQVLNKYSAKGEEIGFVPTMGALHAGHRSLIERSVAENAKTVCSIFVNPTQFTDARDLKHYPRPIEKDIKILEELKADVLFLPSVEEMYPVKEEWHLELGNMDKILEGSSRPGHFQGVTQVVNKLFTLVKPSKAYFGQKDFQQFAVISRMVSLLHHQLALVRCPIVREFDGLAMSSRNVHLQPHERNDALLLSKALFEARIAVGQKSVSQVCQGASQLIQQGKSLRLDYFCIADAESLDPVSDWKASEHIVALVAVWAGKTRLIDNLFLKP